MTARPVTRPGGSGWLYGELLRGVSRSFFITLRVLPGGLREPLSLAYLLARLTDTLADSAQAGPDARLDMLAGFRDAVAAQAERPPAAVATAAEAAAADHWERRLLDAAPRLLRELARQPPEVARLIRAVIATITDGQASDIRRFERAADRARVVCLPDAASLDDYTYSVAGCVGDFWSRLCALRLPRSLRRPLEPMAADGVRFGKGLQLVNILRDIPEDAANGRCYLPGDELAAVGCRPEQLRERPALADPVFRRWLETARSHLAVAGDYVRSLRGWRITFACRLPLALAHSTLDLLGENTPSRRIKVTRAQLRRLALREALLSLR